MRRQRPAARAVTRSGAVWIRSDPGVAIARDLILLLDKTFTAVDAEADRGRREEDQQGENCNETRSRFHRHAPFVRDAGPDWTGMQELLVLWQEVIDVTHDTPDATSCFNFRLQETGWKTGDSRGLEFF